MTLYNKTCPKNTISTQYEFQNVSTGITIFYSKLCLNDYVKCFFSRLTQFFILHFENAYLNFTLQFFDSSWLLMEILNQVLHMIRDKNCRIFYEFLTKPNNFFQNDINRFAKTFILFKTVWNTIGFTNLLFYLYIYHIYAHIMHTFPHFLT